MLMPNIDHALGDAIGRYRLLGEIARGGMGIVYVAAAQGPAGFSKLVALKELRPDLVEDEEFLTMFLEEARMAARLNHPNIVQTNDVDQAGGRHFIAMEYLEGRSFAQLARRLASRGGVPQRMAVSVLRDVLAALDYAHELCGFDGRPLGFVHRDVSPHNIFVTFEGHTKVIDFGIAKARDSSLETKTGVLKGRANYMAPEQLLRRADRRSDIFSVGAVLFEILSGRRLWQGMSELEILAALTRGEIPALDAVRPDTPPALVRVCQKALGARPDERFATAAEMRDALDQHLWATGGAPRNKELGELLMREFDAERQRTRALIEAALARLQAGESGRLEVLELADPRDAAHDSRRGSGRSGTNASRIMPVEHSLRRDHSMVRELPGPGSMVLPNAALPPSLMEPMPTGSWPSVLERHRAWLIGAALAAVFVVTAGIVSLQRGAPAPEPAAPPPAPAAAATPAPHELPAPHLDDTIMMSVGVTPSTAQIYIDGELMPSNPFIGRFVRAGGTHRLRAVAPGYQPKERTVSFADNVMIDLSLNAVPPPPSSSSRREREREPARRESPARRPEPPRPAAVVQKAPPPRVLPSPPPPVAPAVVDPPKSERAERKTDIVPRGEWEPPRKRAIDTSNPYGE